jgi:hypothetical protein
LTVDPLAQIEVLKQHGAITPVGTSGSGTSAVERYRFGYTVRTPHPEDTDIPAQVAVSGTIEVSVAAQKISEISYESTSAWAEQIHMTAHQTVTWAYSDYGAPVAVAVPPSARPVPGGTGKSAQPK